MKHTTSHQYDVRMREAQPKLEKTPKGTALMCPFCAIPHPLWPGEVSKCGTTIVVKAIQSVVPEKRAKRDKLVCLKCLKFGGGDMVKFMSGFVHLHDCTPGARMMVQPPEYSKLARFVYSLSEKSLLRKAIEKRNGKAQIVKEIDAEGKETGTVLGYFFFRDEQVKHGKHPTIGS